MIGEHAAVGTGAGASAAAPSVPPPNWLIVPGMCGIVIGQNVPGRVIPHVPERVCGGMKHFGGFVNTGQ